VAGGHVRGRAGLRGLHGGLRLPHVASRPPPGGHRAPGAVYGRGAAAHLRRPRRLEEPRGALGEAAAPPSLLAARRGQRGARGGRPLLHHLHAPCWRGLFLRTPQLYAMVLLQLLRMFLNQDHHMMC